MKVQGKKRSKRFNLLAIIVVVGAAAAAAGTARGQLFEQKLAGSDGAAFDFFGSSVSISGDTAVAGVVASDGPDDFCHGLLGRDDAAGASMLQSTGGE